MTSKILIEARPAGAGKTVGLIEQLKKQGNSSFTIVAQPTTALLIDTETKLRLSPYPLNVKRIDCESQSDDDNTVLTDISLYLITAPRGVLLITHQALKQMWASDFSPEWDLVIDEMPEFFDWFALDSRLRSYCGTSLVFGAQANGVERVDLSNDGRENLARIKAGHRTYDPDKALKFVKSAKGTVYYAHGFMFSDAFDPEIFLQVRSCRILSATWDSGFFKTYCRANNVAYEVLTDDSDAGLDLKPGDKLNFSPFLPAPKLPEGITIDVRYLFLDKGALSKMKLGSTEKGQKVASIVKLQNRLGTRLRNLFSNGQLLADRKDRAFAVLNLYRDSVIKSARMTGWKPDKLNPDKERRIITAGTTGINHLRQLDTVIYLASSIPDQRKFEAVSATFGYEETYAQYKATQSRNSLYQSVWRGQLRDLRVGDTADIMIIVFGKYEADLVMSCLNGSDGGFVGDARPASEKMLFFDD